MYMFISFTLYLSLFKILLQDRKSLRLTTPLVTSTLIAPRLIPLPLLWPHLLTPHPIRTHPLGPSHCPAPPLACRTEPQSLVPQDYHTVPPTQQGTWWATIPYSILTSSVTATSPWTLTLLIRPTQWSAAECLRLEQLGIVYLGLSRQALVLMWAQSPSQLQQALILPRVSWLRPLPYLVSLTPHLIQDTRPHPLLVTPPLSIPGSKASDTISPNITGLGLGAIFLIPGVMACPRLPLRAQTLVILRVRADREGREGLPRPLDRVTWDVILLLILAMATHHNK